MDSKSSSSNKVSVQLSEDQLSALQAILSQSGNGQSLIDLFASLPKKVQELNQNNNNNNNNNGMSSHQNSDNNIVKNYSDHSPKEMDHHRFVPIAPSSSSSYFNQMQTAINSRPDNNNIQQTLSNNTASAGTASMTNNTNNNISIPQYSTSNNNVDMKAFMALAATNRSLFQGLPSSMYAAAVPNARSSNSQRSQAMDQDSLMMNGGMMNDSLSAVSLVNRPMAGGLLDRMAGSKHPRANDRLMPYNTMPERDRDRHSLFADPNAAGTAEYLANTAYDAYSRRAKEAAPIMYPSYMPAYEPTAKRPRTAENMYGAPMYPYSPAYVMPPPSAYGPYGMGPPYRGVDMDDMDGYEEEEMLVLRGNAPTIFADTKLSQLLTTTDPVPYHIFIVRIAKQYTIPKREARALPVEEREKLLTVPVRFMGSPTTEFFIVAKDLCQLLHIRKGNVAKSIRNVPARDRARMRVVCPKPNGKKGTHVLSVLTVHGLKHLLQSIRSTAASSVLTVLMGQVDRLKSGTQIMYSMATIHGEQHGRGGEQFTVVYQHTNCEHFLKAAKSSKRNSDTESEQETTNSNNNTNNNNTTSESNSDNNPPPLPSDSSSTNNSALSRDARSMAYRTTPSYSSYNPPMSSGSYSPTNSAMIAPSSSTTYKPITPAPTHAY